MINQDGRSRLTSNIKLTSTRKPSLHSSKSRLHVCLTAQSRSSREQFSCCRNSVEWPLHFEKVLSNNNYLVRRIGTNKSQVLHRLRLRQFTPRKLLPDIQIKPQKWKPNPEVSIRHDDLYAIAWERDYETPIFDANNNVTPANSPDIAVWSDLSTKETWNTPGTSLERSPELSQQTEELCDVTDSYP